MKTIQKISMLAFALVIGFTAFSQEEGKVKMDPAEKFQKMDADDNGLVSVDEYFAHKEAKWAEKEEAMTDEHKEKIRIHFAEWDTNKDGSLDMEEFSVMYKKKKMKHKMKMKEGDMEHKMKRKQSDSEMEPMN